VSKDFLAFLFIFSCLFTRVTIINIFLTMYSVNPSYYCFMSCHTCLLYPTLPFVILPQTYLLLFLPWPLPIVSMQLHGILCFSISLLPVEVSVYLSYIRLFNSFLCFLAPVCLLIHKWIQLVFGAILLFDPPG